MTGIGFKNRLAAILAADAVGFSRLMAVDDRATLASLDAARALFRERIEASRGRVIDMAGDSVLAVFDAATDALSTALAIQADLERACAKLPEHRRMWFRIGVHLGDLTEKPDGTVYGDGVNVAARLQSLADPGGVTASGAVRDAVRGRVDVAFSDCGEEQVKNIVQPVHAYKCATGVAPPRSDVVPSKSAVSNQRPSIAVLAFDNMSGDPEQAYFCDGISEDIITDLSKIEGLAVIGRQSAFAYKGQATDLRRVGRELGVRYVLEGSVRKSGSRVRVTAQLIEAETGTHVWAHRYDRELDDIFVVGDEIARDIVETLDIKLAHGEDARIWRRALKTTPAREAFMRGWDAYARLTPEGNRAARELFLEVVRLEPDSPMGYAYVGVTHVVDVMQGWSSNVSASLAEASKMGTKAVELDDASPGGHGAKAIAALFEGRFDDAMAGARKSLEIRPMCATPRANLAFAQLYAGSYEQAIVNAREAVDLNPVYPGWYAYLMAAAQHFAGRHEEALATLDLVLSRSPGLTFARTLRVASLMMIGRADQAKAEASAVLRFRPDFSVDRFLATQPFRDPSQRARYGDSLRAAGLPA